MGQRAIQKSFDGTFLEGEIVAIDGGEQVFVWDLRATGRALTMVAFLVGTLLFLLINLFSVDPEAEWSTTKKDKQRRNQRTGWLNLIYQEKEEKNED